MKKFIMMFVISVMTMTILSVGASAYTTGKVISGNGVCGAVVIQCQAGGNGIICDNSGVQLPETETPEQDNDGITETPDAEKPEQDNDITVETPKQDNDNTVEESVLNEYEKEVIRIVNEIRVSNGLQPFETDEELSRVARIKSQDMKDNNYFSHTSPVYGSPFDMMKQFGISYKSAGENIARGQATPQAVVDGWMNSSGHRANILNASYNRIGVGYVADGNYWTQMFIQK